MILFTPTPFQAFRLPLVFMGSLQYQMSRQKKCGLRTFIQDLMALVKPAFVEYKDRTRTLIVIAIQHVYEKGCEKIPLILQTLKFTRF